MVLFDKDNKWTVGLECSAVRFGMTKLIEG